MDRPLEARPQPLGEFVNDVWTAVVLDGVDRVEAQSVEVKSADPVFRVLDDEVPNRARVGPVEIDCIAPRRPMAVGEEVRRIAREVIPLRSEMIVDHVEQHRYAALVRRFDEGLQVLGPAVARVGGVRADPVVAPAPAATEVGKRHDLDCGRAEVDQMVELARGRGEGAFRGEGADVQLIEDDVVPRPARPGLAPAIGLMVDRLARPVHVLRLEAGCRIGNARPVGELEPIEGARPDPLDEALEETAVSPLHRNRRAPAFEREAHPLLRRGPEPEENAAVFKRRAMRPTPYAAIHARSSSIRVSNDKPTAIPGKGSAPRPLCARELGRSPRSRLRLVGLGPAAA